MEINEHMDMGELVNALYLSKDVRTLGTIDRPLFSAADVGTMLHIDGLEELARSWDDNQINLVDSYGICGVVTIFFTEDGLLELLLSDKGPISLAYRKWALDIYEKEFAVSQRDQVCEHYI